MALVARDKKLPRLTLGVKIIDDWIDMITSAVERNSNISSSGGIQTYVGPMGIHLAMSTKTFAWAKSKTGGIDAKSGDTPGKADVTLWDFDGTSFVTQGVDEEAYNVGSEDVAADKLLLLALTGKYWFVVWEDCEAA